MFPTEEKGQKQIGKWSTQFDKNLRPANWTLSYFADPKSVPLKSTVLCENEITTYSQITIYISLNMSRKNIAPIKKKKSTFIADLWDIGVRYGGSKKPL